MSARHRYDRDQDAISRNPKKALQKLGGEMCRHNI